MLCTRFLHSDWEFAEENWNGESTVVGTAKPSWLPASVPGHVHLDLVSNGVIADPLTAMHELGCQWVDERNWRYRTKFNFYAESSRPRRVLCFDGLDTIAEILLNGAVVGRSDNMFVPLELDVSSALIEGENELEVRFCSAAAEGRERRRKYLEAEGISLDVSNLDERAFVRKAQYMYGWDWGPRLVSCGIWKAVRLIEFEARIIDVHTTQHWHENGTVEIHTTVETEGDSQLSYAMDGAEDLGEGRFLVREPELWTTDQPFLYFVNVYFGQDWKSVPVGLRKLELVRQPDKYGESFEFVLNGQRLWIRGANWIPDHSFPSAVTAARYREQIERAASLGINMLRVWGGGIYEDEAFYDLCDEFGILVWQDFPFGCSYYPEDQAFQQAVAEEAFTNIRRLRNHPSLAVWCGNNENQMMWHLKWGGPEKSPPHHYGLKLYTDLLPGVLAKTDPTRPYIEGSPIYGTHDGEEADPNAGGAGDQHYWDVWHGRGDWRFYADSTARFSSEFGFASSCSAETWEGAGIDSKSAVDSPLVRWHDKTGKGWETFLGMVKLHYPEPSDLEDWIYYSQLNQRDAIKFALEHYRRSDFCRGTLIWQLNDCWPVQSWALIDSKGNLKAAAYELKRVHDDILFSLVRDDDKFVLWGINDGSETQDLPISLSAVDLQSGDIRLSESADASLASGERRQLLELSIRGLASPEAIVFGGSRSRRTWQLAGEPKNARFAKPGTLTVSNAEDGYLQVLADGPVVDLFLTEHGSTRSFEDNFLTSPSSAVMKVPVKAPIGSLEARSLSGRHKIRFVPGRLA